MIKRREFLAGLLAASAVSMEAAKDAPTRAAKVTRLFESLDGHPNGLGTSEEGLWIGEAARLLRLTTDVLRDWERNGLLTVPRDPHNRYRLYGAAEIGRLRVIRMLRRAGYSMMAILRMLLHLDRGEGGDLRQVLDTPRSGEDIYSAADQWLSTLAEQERRAADLIGQLEEMISKQQE